MNKKINLGDFCRVKKSKYHTKDSFVEVLMEIQTGIFLCGNEQGNTIVVAEKLELVGGTDQ